ncbi:hypothetical protein PFISCL1PPCAC_20977, partial [Pristionchus fissidentatus]
LLHLIYPSHKVIHVDSVRFLLALADQFQIQYALDQAESYLIRTSKIPFAEKMQLAWQYKLKSLQHVAIMSYKDINDLKTLQTDEEFETFSEAAKAAICVRLHAMAIKPNNDEHLRW